MQLRCNRLKLTMTPRVALRRIAGVRLGTPLRTGCATRIVKNRLDGDDSNKYRYVIVFDKKALPQEGAYTLADMLGVLQSL